MSNLLNIKYSQTNKSTQTNHLGMREMQSRAYLRRNSQYLIIKSPPASGKSRALMFIALDKLYNQGIKKIIVTVPERSIGGSFDTTKLKDNGFFTDWEVNPQYNLCRTGGLDGKVKQFLNFIESNEKILICTHSTLRFACEKIEEDKFNNTLLAIDEFHHVSADETNNRLGYLLKRIITKSNAHILAMTGSYFRGDKTPILQPEDESCFDIVTYTYYEQLNGYKYLKSLGIGYHFYQGRYTSAINQILDTNKKTILHIPSIQSGESTKNKHQEVDEILDTIGEFIDQDLETGIISLKRTTDGKILKIADLVDDTTRRNNTMNYLRNIKSENDIDIIIALGMAKEGFDWPFCEHALTVGYRGSLTELVQIIGRCTRDSPNKKHAQFTNLIAQPDVEDDLIKVSVNNILKAITCSLLMEQVLSPNFKFKNRITDQDENEADIIHIRGLKTPSSKRSATIIESDIEDIKRIILQNLEIQKSIINEDDAEYINKHLIPKIIKEEYPDLNGKEIEEIRQHTVASMVINNEPIEKTANTRLIKMANEFINIDELHIDLIDKINPFQQAFEIISKSLTSEHFKAIQDYIKTVSMKNSVTEEEAIKLWPEITEFRRKNKREPNLNSIHSIEQRMAQVLIYVKSQHLNYIKSQQQKHGAHS